MVFRKILREYREQLVVLLVIACLQLVLGTTNAKVSWIYVPDKMTTNVTSNLVTTDDLNLHLEYPRASYHCISLILYAGGIIQIVLIVWCCVYYCGTTVRVQEVIEVKMKRVTFGIFICNFVSFSACAFWCCIAWISLKNVNISDSVLVRPMLLSSTLYTSDPEIARSWVQLQVEYECCGVHNYSDWFGMAYQVNLHEWYVSNNSVADSCCKQVTIGCGRNISNPKNIYRDGCLKSLFIHIGKQIQRTVTNWQHGGLYFFILGLVTMCVCIFVSRRYIGKQLQPANCFEFTCVLILWFARTCVYKCVHVYGQVKASIPSNLARHEKTVVCLGDNDHNSNDATVSRVGTNNMHDDTQIDIEVESGNTDTLLNGGNDEEN